MRKVVARSCGAFGGSAFRAVDRGELITIEESRNGARWRVLVAAPVGQFYELADRFGLFDVYRRDAGTLWRIAGAVATANTRRACPWRPVLACKGVSL
jgi:hypothetical protein